MSAWLAGFVVLVNLSAFANDLPFLSSTDTFYPKDGVNCGIDAAYCLIPPSETFSFRCPAGTLSAILQNPRTIGPLQVAYVPLIVGGGPDSNSTYRGDSFLCQSAVHAGIFSDTYGGCASIISTGIRTNFTESTQNGVSSTKFESTFPISYIFDKTKIIPNCRDLKWDILALNMCFSALFILLFGGGWHEGKLLPERQKEHKRKVSATLGGEGDGGVADDASERSSPQIEETSLYIQHVTSDGVQEANSRTTTSVLSLESSPASASGKGDSKTEVKWPWRRLFGAQLLFWVLSCIGFWHISLASNTRRPIPPVADVFADFLPYLFVLGIFWRFTFLQFLPWFDSMPIERLIWIWPAFWTGTLYNDIFNQVPIDQLTPTSISRRPGATTAVILLACIILILFMYQMWSLWRHRVLLPFIAGYSAGLVSIVILTPLTRLQLRLHHYIVGMILLPLAALPNRFSTVMAFILLGIMSDGVSRFGFDSILQNSADLLRDGIRGTGVPQFNMDLYNTTFESNITRFANSDQTFLTLTVSWNPIPSDLKQSWVGFSVIVDDVVRYVGPSTNYSFVIQKSSLAPRTNATYPFYLASVPHFFRVAYVNSFDSTSAVGDYSSVGTILAGGFWQQKVQ